MRFPLDHTQAYGNAEFMVMFLDPSLVALVTDQALELQSTGSAPYQYVIQCRIDRAKQLLTRSELTIVEVCHQVGF